MKIELNIVNTGIQTGSVKWVINDLKDSELVLGETTDKEPAILLNGDILCYQPLERELDSFSQWDKYLGIKHKFAVEAAEEYGLFEYLTPNAVEVVEEFIRGCVKALHTIIENDGAENQTEITIKVQ